jgi:hypothetical protein
MMLFGGMLQTDSRYETGKQKQGAEKVGGRRTGMIWPKKGPKRHRRKIIRRIKEVTFTCNQ